MKDEKQMKQVKRQIQFLIVLAALTISAGCAGRLVSPVYGPVPEGSTNPPPVIGYVPNTNAIAIVNTSAQVGQLVPPPGNWLISGLATLFAVGVGAYARLKTNQATKGQDILNAVITGVEAAGKINPTSTAPVKFAIASHVAASGYGPEFDANVQNVARNTP